MSLGLVHVYTGDGKGKSTCSCGLAVRALGHNFKVLYVQFLKCGNSGEIISLKKLGADILCIYDINKFVWDMTESEIKDAKQKYTALFQSAVNMSHAYDVLVLDEIFGAVTNNMVEENSVTEFIKRKPLKLELVLTGRGAPRSILNLANYVSEIKDICNPICKGLNARKGIEF